MLDNHRDIDPTEPGQLDDEPHPEFARDERKLASETDPTVGAEELEIARIARERDELEEQDAEGLARADAPEQEAEAPHATEEERLRGELDRHQRALADAINARRRAEERASTQVERANEEFVAALLPVVDSFRRARQAADGEEATLESLREGLSLIERQLQQFLAAVGVEMIEAEVGQEFDENQHEALLRRPTEDVPEGRVAALLEPGFRLGGRVVRPAQVAVSAPALDTQA